MLNKRPIIINAFARGGSNIIMNFLLSHPEVCISSGETHKVFKGTKWDSWQRKVKKRICFDFPIRLLTMQDLMGAKNYKERRMIPFFLEKYIDQILYFGRFTATLKTHNYFKSENVKYSKKDLYNCRLLTKGLNGIVFTTELFNKIYPDATFLALVRNGLAVCEGHIRRGYSAEKIGEYYNNVTKKMIYCSENMENYHLLKYEDMVRNPHEFMKKIYKHADLDIESVKKVRLQSKKIMSSSGERSRIKGKNRQVFWYEFSELGNTIKPNINKNQIKQLSSENMEKFLKITRQTMEKLEYI